MTHCDLDTSVPDWVVEHPDVLPLLQELGIDYCCGGKSMGHACREKGFDAKAILAKLIQLVEASARRPS